MDTEVPKMKIGVYIPQGDPRIGGSSSLLKTILGELKSSGNKGYEYVILFKSNPVSRMEFKKDGITYININSYKLKVLLKCYLLRIKYAFKDLGRVLWLREPIHSEPSWMDLLAKEKDIDLYWFTIPLQEKLSTPYIYTVWDLGHRDHAEFPEFRESTYDWDIREATYQNMLPRASYIITGNEKGKQDILENYPVFGNKVRIARFPISDFCYGEEKQPETELPQRYYIYPAQFWAHKNHIRIIEAVRILRDKYDLPVDVLFTGHDYINKTYLHDIVQQYHLEDRIHFLGFVSQEQLKYLYTHAVGLVYASLMGPNNLPPLEAAYLRCPVILTDLVGHREQMGNAAIYFDGYNAEDLAEKMRVLWNNENARTELINEGCAIAQTINPDSYVQAVEKVFHEYQMKLMCWKQTDA